MAGLSSGRVGLALISRQATAQTFRAPCISRPSSGIIPLRSGFHSQRNAVAAVPLAARGGKRETFNWSAIAAVAFAGVTGSAYSYSSRNSVQCESLSKGPELRSYAAPGASTPAAEEPESIVNAYQLSFGAICGICAGVFIKKGLKLIAFLLGGGFVLLQYLSQQRLVKVDWNKIGARYNSALESSAGGPADPAARGWNNSMAARLYHRFVDFLTANFQERATLLAGLALGLRLG